MKIKKQFILFSIIGTMGLIVDLTVLYFTSQVCDFIFARLISFICAVLTTWALNRKLTFNYKITSQLDFNIYYSYLNEFAKYFIANLFGGVINLSTYYLYLTFNKSPADIYIATVSGGVAGLILNFVLSKQIVFKQKK